jgi:hypothetical protein
VRLKVLVTLVGAHHHVMLAKIPSRDTRVVNA